MYGLETVVTNTGTEQVRHFSIKRLAKRLKLQTTYVNRTYSNDYVRTQVNQTLKDATCKVLPSLTEWHKLRLINYLATLTSADTE